MKVQLLDNVCNGGHLWDLEHATKEELARYLFSTRKVVAIVGNEPTINDECDCEDCQNPYDPQGEARRLLDTIVATGNKGMLVTWQGEHGVYKNNKGYVKEPIERKTTLYAKRVGAWSENAALYFIKTIPIE